MTTQEVKCLMDKASNTDALFFGNNEAVLAWKKGLTDLNKLFNVLDEEHKKKKEDVIKLISDLEKFERNKEIFESWMQATEEILIKNTERSSMIRQPTTRGIGADQLPAPTPPKKQQYSHQEKGAWVLFSLLVVVLNCYAYDVFGNNVEADEYIGESVRLSNSSDYGFVVGALDQHCHNLPVWMDQTDHQVYFGPIATLLLSVGAVVAFLFVNHLQRYFIVQKTFHWITNQRFVDSSPKSSFRRVVQTCHQVPENTQIEFMIEFRRRFANNWNIPDIGIPSSGTFSSDLSHLASKEFLDSFDAYSAFGAKVDGVVERS